MRGFRSATASVDTTVLLCFRFLRPLRPARFSVEGTKILRKTLGCSLLDIITAGGVLNAATSCSLACLHALWFPSRTRFPHTRHRDTLRRFTNISPSGSAPPQALHFFHSTSSNGVAASIPTHVLCHDRSQSSH